MSQSHRLPSPGEVWERPGVPPLHPTLKGTPAWRVQIEKIEENNVGVSFSHWVYFKTVEPVDTQVSQGKLPCTQFYDGTFKPLQTV